VHHTNVITTRKVTAHKTSALGVGAAQCWIRGGM